MRKSTKILANVLLLLALIALPATAQVGKAFTYQGRLTDAGSPPYGTYDVEFRLFDALVGGAQVGPTFTFNDLLVTNGLITARLDFGSVYTGAGRWLQISVRPGASVGAFTPLAPRQELTAAPYASGLALPVAETSAYAGTSLLVSNTSTGIALGGVTTNADGTAIVGSKTSVPSAGKLGSEFTTTLGGASTYEGGIVGTSAQIGGYSATTSSGYAGFLCESDGWNAIAGVTRTGNGIWAQATEATGAAARLIGSGISTTSQGSALEISGGGINVPGAGLNSMTPVFIHRATADNVSGAVTYIDHPLTNEKSGAILIVTQNWTAGSTYNAHEIGVFYSTSVSKWAVFNEDLASMPSGASFNVLVFGNTPSKVAKAGETAAHE